MNYLEIKKLLEKNRNDKNKVHMEKYMKNKFLFYGIKTPLRKKLFKEFLKEEKKKKTIDWNLLDALYKDDYRECQYIVIDYLKSMKKYIFYEDIPKILKYAKIKQWWDTIDNFDQIIGDIGLLDSRVDDLMLLLSTDEDFWLRRLSIDHQLLRKDRTNTELLEKILKNNLNSDEFFINKAIGWALRDYSKTNPIWVQNFIKENKNSMSKLSIREASKYIGR